MDMDQAAVFLAGSILTMLGFVVVVAGILVINNLLNKFWKPITLIRWQDHYQATRFATPEEMEKIAPHLEDEKKDQKAK